MKTKLLFIFFLFLLICCSKSYSQDYEKLKKKELKALAYEKDRQIDSILAIESYQRKNNNALEAKVSYYLAQMRIARDSLTQLIKNIQTLKLENENNQKAIDNQLLELNNARDSILQLQNNIANLNYRLDYDTNQGESFLKAYYLNKLELQDANFILSLEKIILGKKEPNLNHYSSRKDVVKVPKIISASAFNIIPLSQQVLLKTLLKTKFFNLKV